MSSIVVNGDTSGSVTLSAPAVAGSVTVTLPSTSGTMAVTAGSPSFTDITATGNLTVNGNTTLGDASTDTILMTGAPSIGGAGLGMGFGFRNRIINGAMGIWQRATSYNMTASWAYGSVDRWTSTSSPSTNGVFNRSTSVPTGFQYSVQMGRTAASSATSPIQCTQAIESVNCYDLAGQTVTLSFWAKAGANFSASGNILGSQIGTGTVADQAASNFYSWTGGVQQNQNNTITTTWTRYTHTVTIASNVLEVGINFYYTPTGTAGADDNVYITGVQLEKGSTATSFDYRPYGTEFALCQRYYETYSNGTGTGAIYEGITGNFATTAVFRGFVPFKVTKRASPSVTVPTTYTTINWSGGNITPSSGGSNFSSVEGASINFTTSTVVAGQAATAGISSSAPVIISAEL